MTKNQTLRQTALVALLATSAALAACGGGGGGAPTAASGPSPSTPSPSTPSPSTPAAVVAPAGTLKDAIPAATYADNSLQLSAFNALNQARKYAGAGLIAQSAALDTAAEAHAKYLTTNINTVFTAGAHIEDPSKPDFYEATLATRMAKAGFNLGSYGSEVVGGTGASRLGADCIWGLLGTVYHAAALLGQATNIGFGFGRDTANVPMCVADFGSLGTENYPQVAPAGQIVAYPYDGQTGVLYSFDIASEVPRPPVALFPSATSGTPVIVSVRNADFVNFKAAGTLNAVVTKFEMKDASGNIVPAGILASPGISGSGVTMTADPMLAEGFLVLVPFAPLTKGATYMVNVNAILRDGGAPLSKTWSFVSDRDR